MTDLAGLLARAWQLRRLMWIAVLAAIVAGLLITYKVSLSPFKFEDRQLTRGVAKVDVLVEAQKAPVTNLNLSVDALNQRTKIFAEFASTPQVRFETEQAAGLPQGRLNVKVQSFNANGGQASAPESEATLLSEIAGYRLDVAAQTELPIISFSAQAPTAGDAARIATGGADALIKYLGSLSARQGKPTEKELKAPGVIDYGSVRLRKLGAATGGQVTSGGGYLKGVVLGLVVFIVMAIAIIFISGVARELRARTAIMRERVKSAGR